MQYLKLKRLQAGIKVFVYGKSHPGKRIEELMPFFECHTQHDLSLRLQVSEELVRLLIIGKKKISVETAMRLAIVFGEANHTAHQWLDMQTAYDLYKPDAEKRFQELSVQLLGKERTGEQKKERVARLIKE